MKPDPLDNTQRHLYKRLGRLRLLAGITLLCERLVIAFGALVLWVGLFFAIWMLDLPQTLGLTAKIFTLFLFIAGFALFMDKALKVFSWPKSKDIDHRLEQDSNLPHRPLSLLNDRLANPEKPDTRTLWAKNHNRAWESLGHLKPPHLKPVLSKTDPFALRTLVLLVFFASLIIAGPDAPARLKSGLHGFAFHEQETTHSPVVLWVTPPAYTRLPRVTVEGYGKIATALDVPEGSILKVRLNGGLGTPHLLTGDQELTFKKLDGSAAMGNEDEEATARKTSNNDSYWALETVLDAENTDIEISQIFRPRFSMPLNVIEDQPPSISLKEDPHIRQRGLIEVPLTVEDDYGVTDLTLTMTLVPQNRSVPRGTTWTETRTITTAGKTPQDIKPLYDLGWHPWVGLPVILSITAKDGAGHSTALPSIEMTLPERLFFHPLAKTLAELRQDMIWAGKSTREDALDILTEMIVHPSSYRNDPLIFLSLRTMIARLVYDHSEAAINQTIEQLWDTAITLEDGNVALAARNLREKRQALEALLNDENATEEDIAAAMADLRQAMAEYFQELHKDLQQRLAQGEIIPQIPPEALENVLTADDLNALLEELQSQATSGDRMAAKQMLSQLQQLMDSMDPSMMSQPSPQMEFMQDGISQLQELINKQKALREQTQEQAGTYRHSQPQQYPEPVVPDEETAQKWQEEDMPPPPHKQQNRPQQETQSQAQNYVQTKDAQDQLRYDLGDLMLKADENLGEIPQNMQDAEKEMRGAVDRLGENRPDLAVPSQSAAIEKLEQAQQQMQQQMQKMMQQGQGMAFGSARDPLGRPYSPEQGSSSLPYSDIKIPDETERKKVREILQELREKSGEFNRPDYELEYYKRLMRQF